MEVSVVNFKEFAAGLQSLATVVSFVVGGYWVYKRYIQQQEGYAHVESSAEIVLLGEQDGAWIVELAGILENKGKVEHRISGFEFDLNVLFSTDKVEASEQFGGQTFFPHCLLKGSLLPRQYSNFFIGPGVKARYSYVANIPKEANYAMFHCWFEYSDRPDSGHAAEKTVNLSFLAKTLVAGAPQSA